jgi:hypothetical protein
VENYLKYKYLKYMEEVEEGGADGEGGVSEPASGGDGSAAPSRKHHIDVGNVGDVGVT